MRSPQLLYLRREGQMASLEDLILNGKPAGYCSSSEDEEDDKAASASGPRPGPAPPGSARNVCAFISIHWRLRRLI
jgi:hypothetical protein